MCSARWLKLSHSGVCKKRVYLHTRRQVYATNWCQRFKVAPISMCTHTHTQRYCLTLVRGIPWTCFNTRVEFRGQFSNFKETLIIFPDFKEGKKINKAMQQSHFSCWNDLQLLQATPGFAINESETQTTYTQTEKLRTLKLPQQSWQNPPAFPQPSQFPFPTAPTELPGPRPGEQGLINSQNPILPSFTATIPGSQSATNLISGRQNYTHQSTGW